ncbi:MAG: hypothetical protein F6K23_22010 [Okeania sp. SIO2C9]|uniref:hypothetical protein n=1 Tax=Okeania sp. SIO2C9 TaxID=2607791 RepID=UPI0013C2113B|nr:hypothetical protein [Okeania sp. SIO2C9]NEQ75490.1 hypothetical protein [Okeania sp. SIO2C9]
MNNQENGFWECSGDENNRHILLIMSPDENECRAPGCSRKKPRPKTRIKPPKPEPDGTKNGSYSTNNNGNNGNNPSNIPTDKRDNKINTEPKPKRDIKLLIALTILNIGSGFTTMRGAAQILPRIVGWSSGAAIQALLFLLTSGSTLKHDPFSKWMAVGAFSILSVYTSFFAYYDYLVVETREKDGFNRAISAHQNLVREIFTPIEEKAQQLENEIKSKDAEIERELKGEGLTGIVGDGPRVEQLRREKDKLLIRFDQVKPVANELRPLFDYDLEGKEPQEIFNADRKALAQVKPKCLPTEPEFVCLPEKYNGSLDPLNPKYKKLQEKYFDKEDRIRFIAPFQKIKNGEEAAIAAAFFALLVDGVIIFLGTKIEIPPPRKPEKFSKTITLRIKGTGTEFLDKLLEAIDNMSGQSYQELFINQELLKENQTQYQKLLQSLSNETTWIEKNEKKQWVIYDEKKFTDWVIKEGERLIKNEDQNNSNTKSSNIVTFYLPDDDITE